MRMVKNALSAIAIASAIVSACALAFVLAAAATSIAMPDAAFANSGGNSESGSSLKSTHYKLAASKDSLAATKSHEAKQYRAVVRKEKLTRRVIPDGLFNIGSASRKGLSLSASGSTVASSESRDDANWHQKWAIAWDVKTGYYTIRNLATRKFLSISGTVKSGAPVRQVGTAKTAAQLWHVVQVPGGIALMPAGSNLALTTTSKSGTGTFRLYKAYVKVRTGASTAQAGAQSTAPAAQTFTLNAVDALDADQTYFIRNVATGKCLHVARDSRAANARLDLAAPASKKSEKFRLLKSGAAYRLQNVSSCYYVGTNEHATGAARQLASTSGNLTRWDIKLNPKAAAFTIASKQGGTQLDGSAGTLALRYDLGTDAQLFTFTQTYAFKLYLNPGHGWNDYDNGAWDTGATGSGHEEAEFSHDLARRVEALLANTDVQVINGEPFQLPYWERMPKAVSLRCDAIVSIHFDAGGGSGTLKMVGVQGKAPGSEELAQTIHERIVASLGLRDRGPSERSDITCVNGPIPSMLTEICFMDNPSDVERYLERRDDVARAIADGIVKASRNRKVLR